MGSGLENNKQNRNKRESNDLHSKQEPMEMGKAHAFSVQPTVQSANKPTVQLMSQSTGETINLPTGQSTGKPTGIPTGKVDLGNDLRNRQSLNWNKQSGLFQGKIETGRCGGSGRVQRGTGGRETGDMKDNPDGVESGSFVGAAQDVVAKARSLTTTPSIVADDKTMGQNDGRMDLRRRSATPTGLLKEDRLKGNANKGGVKKRDVVEGEGENDEDRDKTGLDGRNRVPTGDAAPDGNYFYKINGLDKEFPSLSALVVHHSIMQELLPCLLNLRDQD